jgi:CheY-like chemotaxis protein
MAPAEKILMPVTLPQLTVIADAAGPRVVGRSAGVTFDTEEAVLKTISRFGRLRAEDPPAGVFVTLAGDGNTKILTSFRRGDADVFRVVLADKRMPDLDPFEVTSRLAGDPPRGELPPLECDGLMAPSRPVDRVRHLLQSGDAPLLLGSAQALLDGCKLAPAAPDVGPEFVTQVFELLPFATRVELTFATFAPSAEMNFDVAVVRDVPPGGGKGFLTAEQARDYPEGRYELALQRAAENGNQAELDRLFARRTSSQVLRMVTGMIVFAFVVVLVLKFL